MATVVYAALFYLATVAFVGGLAVRIAQFARTPTPLRIPTTPAPTTRTGAGLRVAREVVLFQSLFKSNKWIWLFGWGFHVTLALVVLRHLRYFLQPVPAVVGLVHGDAECAAAQEASAALFSGRVATLDESTLLDVASEVPTSTLDMARVAEGVLLVDLLAETGLVASKGEARRAIEQNGAFVNDQARSGLDALVTSDDLLHGRYLVLRRGKRSYHLVTVA